MTLNFDQTASESYVTDFGRLAEIGREGVLALLSDLANADSNIQVASESEVAMKLLKPLIGIMNHCMAVSNLLVFSRS